VVSPDEDVGARPANLRVEEPDVSGTLRIVFGTDRRGVGTTITGRLGDHRIVPRDARRLVAVAGGYTSRTARHFAPRAIGA